MAIMAHSAQGEKRGGRVARPAHGLEGSEEMALPLWDVGLRFVVSFGISHSSTIPLRFVNQTLRYCQHDHNKEELRA